MTSTDKEIFIPDHSFSQLLLACLRTRSCRRVHWFFLSVALVFLLIWRSLCRLHLVASESPFRTLCRASSCRRRSRRCTPWPMFPPIHFRFSFRPQIQWSWNLYNENGPLPRGLCVRISRRKRLTENWAKNSRRNKEGAHTDTLQTLSCMQLTGKSTNASSTITMQPTSCTQSIQRLWTISHVGCHHGDKRAKLRVALLRVFCHFLNASQLLLEPCGNG